MGESLGRNGDVIHDDRGEIIVWMCHLTNEIYVCEGASEGVSSAPRVDGRAKITIARSLSVTGREN
jgi:hypothetical protein